MWNEDQLNTLTGQWVEQAEVVTTETYDNLSVGDFYDKLTAYRETLNTTSEEAEQENGQVEQDTGGELPAQDGTSDGQTQEDAGAQDSGSKDAAPQEEGAADQGEGPGRRRRGEYPRGMTAFQPKRSTGPSGQRGRCFFCGPPRPLSGGENFCAHTRSDRIVRLLPVC